VVDDSNLLEGGAQEKPDSMLHGGKSNSSEGIAAMEKTPCEQLSMATTL